MASSAIEKLVGQMDRIKMREKAKAVAQHVQTQNVYAMGSALLGAVAAGVVDAKYNADGSSKKTTVVLSGTGLLLALGGATDYIPGGIILGMGGVGVLCYVAGKASHDKAKDHFATA